MKKIIFTYLILISVSMFASDVTKSSQGFVSICIDKSAVGYSWKGKEWSQTNFINSKKIIKKITSDWYCKNEDVNKQLTESTSKDLYVESCYAIDNMYLANRCTETWIRTSNTMAKLVSFSCDSPHGTKIRFELEGNFIASHISPKFFNEPNRDYYDSIYISHGKCTTIVPN